ncbi:MAG TPA: TIGR04282 family arsenosugar biosynthesis glycosyltransferase [Armatimonadota bacterium]|nr:TIGR04282 family arsenosugar biosynthesis glycosyltransferase [Armatimonadota bacterium]
MRRRLIIFTKAPVPGEAKTRLCPPLLPAEAAQLAEAFLLDEVETLSALPGCRVSVAFTPADAAPLFRRILGDPMVPWLAVQSPGDLGNRLHTAFAAACPSWWPVAIIGSDSPDLPPGLVEEAFKTLEEDAADVVVGPTVDGGYYLIAARQAHAALFRDIPWSTPAVLAATVERAEQAGLRLRLLPIWEDVDEIDDLYRLRDRLHGAPPLVAPRTRAVIRSLGKF